MAVDFKDARLYTTPLGALAGLAVTRSLIAKKDRNVFNQGAGAATGAALGYAGGGYLNDEIERPDVGDYKGQMALNIKNFGKRDPADFSEPTKRELLDTMASLPPTVKQNIPESSLRGMFAQKRLGELRAGMSRMLAKSNPDKADAYNRAAAHWLSYSKDASKRMENSGGVLNRLFSIGRRTGQ
jgi:hypothetical protein